MNVVIVMQVEEFGDPYKEEIEQCVRLVMDRVRARGWGNHHTLAYQSRVGPVRLLPTFTSCVSGLISLDSQHADHAGAWLGKFACWSRRQSLGIGSGTARFRPSTSPALSCKVYAVSVPSAHERGGLQGGSSESLS